MKKVRKNLKRFIRTYPASNYIPYANYLLAIISFEQILDEKRDLKPTRESKKLILEYFDLSELKKVSKS